ncbi:ATP-binding protein [uncultured Duncaniella sp.]|uniref:ATP-binding protein n=2 Tax=uncultured Duncaniella sp. TaxID=2768039 RepID=UPI0025DC2151|nr:DUF4143 domain-containing protein [uncultured Duncaniella sp.]
MDAYRPRVIEALLKRKLRSAGAILVEGAKWCGKSTTAAQFANSHVYLANPATYRQNMTLAEVNPSALLEGETPRLIDEWQLAPELWDAVRGEVDMRGRKGQFILTGSAVPPSNDKIHHTGTGRFAWLTMRPMSLYESGDSSGEVSLESLFAAPDMISGNREMNLDELSYLICRGGWPSAVGLDREDALEEAYDYFDAVVKTDISRVDGVTRSVARTQLFMRAYARSQGSQTALTKLRADMLPNDSATLDVDTVSSYHNALKKIFVVEDMPSWNPNLRSKSAIRTSDTRYFVDPSIATSALGCGPDELKGDLETLGLIFETLCVRDLRVYSQPLNGEVYHYRDSSGLECDAVVHLRNGHYGLVEIKLGGETAIESAVKTLNKLESNIDTDKMKAPSFKMVLIGVGQYAYRRKDGIYVVPVSCLKN